MRARFSHCIAASLLVILWIATPLLAVAHVALEEHSFCAEHERLEEAGDEHGHADAGKADRKATEESALLTDVSAGQSSAAHLGCSFGESFTRTCVAAPGAPQLVAFAQDACASVSAPRSSVAIAIDLLRLAPKSSPPHIS